MAGLRGRRGGSGHGIELMALVALGVLASTTVRATSATTEGHRHPVDRRPVLDCTVATMQSLVPAGMDATVDSAQMLTTPVPYCRVDGQIIAAGRPVSNVPIRFQVSLPDVFNGRYFMQASAFGQSASPPSPAKLAEGFAVATTGKGCLDGLNPLSCLSDPGQEANFERRSTHLSAQVTQRITKKYYSGGFHRYIAGCSGGGSTGYVAIRMYPNDFDGAVVSAGGAFTPGATGHYAFSKARIAQYLQRHPDAWISPELLAAGQNAIISTYDGADGVVDGMIQDDRLFRLDLDLLRNVGYTEAQIDAVKFILRPYVYRGSDVPIPVAGHWVGGKLTQWGTGTGLGYFGTVPPPYTSTTVGAPFGFLVPDWHYGAVLPGFDWINDLNINNPAHHKLLSSPSNGSREKPFDLRGFRDAGGKVVFFSGVEDPTHTYLNGAVAREEMAAFETAGHSGRPHPRAEEKLANWARFFFVPGRQHCAGAPGPADIDDRALDAVIKWVEQGKAPDSIVATRAPRSFLLCPEPARAVFKGGNRDINDAKNWKCVTERNVTPFPRPPA